MKTLFVILAGIIFAHSSALSQNSLSLKDNKVNDDFFSWSYELGFGGSSNSRILSYQSHYQYNTGIELSLRAKGLNEFFISYNFQKFGNPKYDYETPLSLSCISTGPRLHLFRDKNVFAEAAFVTYILNGSGYNDDLNLNNSANSPFEGFSIGFGKDYKINESISMSLSAKMYGIFSRPGIVVLYCASSRFNFNSGKNSESNTVKRDPSHWAFTLLGGTNNPDFFVNTNYLWGLTYGVETALKTSNSMETTLAILNNNYTYLYPRYLNPEWGYSEHTNYNTFDILVGERVFINHDVVSSFLNAGAGLYSSYQNNTDYSYYDRQITPNFGIYFGSGLIVHVYKSLSINVGSTCNLIFSEDIFASSHLKLTGGLRYDL
jgi:hypothetical protein